MNKRKRFGFAPTVGGVSLLVVFAVLCLSVFAMMSVATARADGRLSEASIKSVSDYYAADCHAQKILAQLRTGTLPDGVSADGDIYSFSCPISETQRLSAEIRMNGTDYTILRWQAVNAGEWDMDEDLHLWSGEMDE